MGEYFFAWVNSLTHFTLLVCFSIPDNIRKLAENLWISEVFRRYRKRSVAENG